MLIRYLLPLLAWVGVVFLLTFRTYVLPTWSMGGFTNYTLIQCLLFIGYAHISLGVLKKQLKYEKLRDNALIFVIVSGILFSVLLEVTRYKFGFSSYFNFWNMIFNGIGVFLGMCIFRLVYRGCE